MPTIEELDAMLENHVAPHRGTLEEEPEALGITPVVPVAVPALETTPGEPPEPAPQTSDRPNDGRQPHVPVVVRDTTRAAFEALRAAGEPPSVRKVYEAVKGSYNLVAAEVKALRQAALAATDALPAVTAARAQRAEADRHLDAYVQEVRAAEDALAACVQEVQALERQAIEGHVEAAQALPEARRRRLDATLRVAEDLPALRGPLDQAIEDATIVLVRAEREQARLHYNQLAEVRAALYPRLRAAIEVLHDLGLEFLALANTQRELATSLDVGFPQGGGPSPERYLAWLLQSGLHDVAPPPPQQGIRGVLPDVAHLPLSDTTTHPLTPEQGATDEGGARAWVAYRGKALSILTSYGIRRSLGEQHRWQHGQAIQFSLDELATLRLHHPEGLVICSPPVWGDLT